MISVKRMSRLLNGTPFRGRRSAVRVRCKSRCDSGSPASGVKFVIRVRQRLSQARFISPRGEKSVIS